MDVDGEAGGNVKITPEEELTTHESDGVGAPT